MSESPQRMKTTKNSVACKSGDGTKSPEIEPKFPIRQVSKSTSSKDTLGEGKHEMMGEKNVPRAQTAIIFLSLPDNLFPIPSKCPARMFESHADPRAPIE